MALRVLLAVGVLLAVALVAGRPGRAEPTGSYRPELVADPIRIGCYPLPGGVGLDFPYVVRRDGDVRTPAGERRSLVLHWSLLDLDEVRDRLTDTFAQAGFHVTDRGTTASALSLSRPGPGGRVTHVEARLTPLDNPSPDPIVRGVLELDLPVVARSSPSPECDNPYVTKRFGGQQ